MQRKDLAEMHRDDLTDEQWEKLCASLPVSGKGRPFDNMRSSISDQELYYSRIKPS